MMILISFRLPYGLLRFKTYSSSIIVFPSFVFLLNCCILVCVFVSFLFLFLSRFFVLVLVLVTFFILVLVSCFLFLFLFLVSFKLYVQKKNLFEFCLWLSYCILSSVHNFSFSLFEFCLGKNCRIAKLSNLPNDDCLLNEF